MFLIFLDGGRYLQDAGAAFDVIASQSSHVPYTIRRQFTVCFFIRLFYLSAGAASGLASSIIAFFPLYVWRYTSWLTKGDSKFPIEISACLMCGATSLNESLYE